MKSREIIKREVNAREKIKLLISSSVLISLLISMFLPSNETPSTDQPVSPVTTPGSGPRLSR